MELSGHKDIRMLRRYSHTREEAKRIAVERLGERINDTVIDTSLDTIAEEEGKKLSVTP